MMDRQNAYFALIILAASMVVAVPQSDEQQLEQDDDDDSLLGEDKAFDKLTPKESKRHLERIVDRIDKDKDGFVTLPELEHWITATQSRRYVSKKKNRIQHNTADSATISWDAKQLIFAVDTNSDEKLTKDEILVKYDIFVDVLSKLHVL